MSGGFEGEAREAKIEEDYRGLRADRDRPKRRNGKNGDSVSNAVKDILNRRISALMETNTNR